MTLHLVRKRVKLVGSEHLERFALGSSLLPTWLPACVVSECQDTMSALQDQAHGRGFPPVLTGESSLSLALRHRLGNSWGTARKLEVWRGCDFVLLCHQTCPQGCRQGVVSSCQQSSLCLELQGQTSSCKPQPLLVGVLLPARYWYVWASCHETVSQGEI